MLIRRLLVYKTPTVRTKQFLTKKANLYQREHSEDEVGHQGADDVHVHVVPPHQPLVTPQHGGQHQRVHHHREHRQQREENELNVVPSGARAFREVDFGRRDVCGDGVVADVIVCSSGHSRCCVIKLRF